MPEKKIQTKAFISYASRDKKYFEKLVEGLKGHSQGSSIMDWNFWDDREILMGAGWHNSIQTAIDQSDFAVLLVSRNFVNSGYIQEHELEIFLQAQKERGFLVFPILVLPYDISRIDSLASLQFFKPLYRDYFYEGRLSESTELMPFSKVAKDDDMAEEYYIDLVKAIEKAIRSSSNNINNSSSSRNKSFIQRQQKQKVTWKTENSKYWLYFDGEHHEGTVSTYVDDDVIVYDPKTNASYMLYGYRHNVDGVEKEAVPIHSSSSAFYRNQDGSYWFYLEGSNKSKQTNSAWVDDSLLIYEPESHRHFLFRDFKFHNDNKLYPAVELFSKTGVFWKQKDGSYWFYVNGTHVTGTKSRWHGNDLIVTNHNTGKEYLLEDYNQRADNQLRIAPEWFKKNY